MSKTLPSGIDPIHDVRGISCGAFAVIEDDAELVRNTVLVEVLNRDGKANSVRLMYTDAVNLATEILLAAFNVQVATANDRRAAEKQSQDDRLAARQAACPRHDWYTSPGGTYTYCKLCHKEKP